MGWTAGQLASLYGEALESGEDCLITPSWIYMMERKNMVPLDKKRRWILARLLDIPPILFGLELSDPSCAHLFAWERVDVVEYRSALESYCQGWHSGSVFQAISDIKGRILHLHKETSDTFTPEKRLMLQLLCGYYILLGQLALDYMDFDAAIESLDKAVQVAEQEHFYDILVYALHERGCIYRSRGEITAGLHGYDRARSDFLAATQDYRQVQSLSSRIPPTLHALVSLGAGIAYAHVAQNNKALDDALKIIELGNSQIGKRVDDLPIAKTALLDEERYHLDRASTYLASPLQNQSYAKLAQEELEMAVQKTGNSRIRKASSASRLAKSYFLAGEYEMAVFATEEALSPVLASGSTMNLARLDVIYQGLKKSPFGESADVALLGVKLFQVQHPHLFQ
jgi:tetratricopeptide (TPR) repeat protein